MADRVVITGLGAVTPIGIGKDKFWENLLAGKSGIGKITHFDATEFKAQIAGQVNDFEATDFIDKKEARRMDRYTQFAIAATRMAFEDAKIDLSKEDKERIGVFIGTGIGGIETMHEQYTVLLAKGPNRISPFCVPMMIANMATGQTSITFGLQGPSCCPITACATGTNAIGDAMRVIQRGEADVMVAGGTEACISPLPVAGFASMKALCTNMNDNPEKASRPFDKNRSGFVMGEGSGIVVLESLTHALKRGAEIYAEVSGYAATSDAYHITSPAPAAIQPARCFSLAIKDAGLQPEDIDYINAHGTSTQLNERTETAAIKKAFGAHAYKLAISSIKSMIGHLLGAAGGIECIATALTVKNDMIPATINLETPDENLDLDYVPNIARKKVVNAAISDSLGFGGHNATILLKKFK
ncbi:beta-ketoacyl-ACP synthase II [Pectinatus cerevisiiphilus]|uniref:3-oxoacyl-[acyl-carrier-protein] synthase 2 n=1 Tax=Pectinatus cerevisiiphilus TaxID=86956 RepID=A0A4R3K9H1_9FIRM|nr:beta-ketoacyl-ACP synthase II [Pectinatus cerevisiiphilus]TCS79674.1 3-oxoacyl-[acyl-carrier-protein] synthase II [Pectinatus cerevisiiphilus]